MGDPMAGTSDPKYTWVERYGGIILKELLVRSTEVKGDSVTVRPRYFVHLITYGGKPDMAQCQAPEGGIYKGLNIEETLNRYTAAQNSLGLGGKLGGTDTDAALMSALRFLESCVAKYKTCFPPMVFHLTDGESQTDPELAAERLRQFSTDDGHVLLVNAFIGERTNLNYRGPEDFPGYIIEQEAGPSEYSARLFRMSSEIPATVRANLVNDGIFPTIREGARLYFDVRTKDMLKHVIQVVGSQGSR